MRAPAQRPSPGGPGRPGRRGRVRVGLTLGDPNGIGPEIALRAAHAARAGRLPGMELVLVGSVRALSLQARALGFLFPPPGAPGAGPGRRGPVRIWDPAPSLAPPWRPGRVTAAASIAACAWIEAALAACGTGALDALVTGPISKEGFARAAIPYAGHTELLAARTGAPSVGMMLLGGRLRVLLATRHIPLRSVPDALTPAALDEALGLAAQALDWLGIPGGRIGVCGLNPHAGEGGSLGEEERRRIAPAIARARRRGLPVEGPLAGDSAFCQAALGRYDLVVAMYHDQGLGPLKLEGFPGGVNLTLGLPVVRTSPAHGTAFDRAGRGRARDESLIAALRLAARLARRPSPWRIGP